MDILLILAGLALFARIAGWMTRLGTAFTGGAPQKYPLSPINIDAVCLDVASLVFLGLAVLVLAVAHIVTSYSNHDAVLGDIE